MTLKPYTGRAVILLWLSQFEGMSDDEFDKHRAENGSPPSITFVAKDKYHGDKTLEISANNSFVFGVGGKYVMHCFDDLSYANAHYFESYSLMKWENIELDHKFFVDIKTILRNL